MCAFHNVSQNGVPGALVLATADDELIFWWRSYPQIQKGKLAPKQDKQETVIGSKNIQKIIVNYREKEAFIMINSRSSGQFFLTTLNFPNENRDQLLHLIQLITVNMCQNRPEPPTLDAFVDFMTETMALNRDKYDSFDMDVDCGQFTIPLSFCTNGILPKKLVVVQPDLNIVSKYQINAGDFINNPITEAEIQTFATTEELKKAVAKRGVSPNIRHIVWPIIFDVLPLDPEKREEALKHRVEEYKNIKNQWTSLSKQQIKSWTAIKDAFATIRVDVKRTHPPPNVTVTDEWYEILVSLLRSFTIWNRNLRYTQGLNDLASNIMIHFCKPTCTALDDDVAEALSFWCFANFVEVAGNGLVTDNMMKMQQKELKEIFEIIERFSPNSKWLTAMNMTSLSFLISPFMLAYGRSFDKQTIARLWETLISVPDPWCFLKHFSASLIIFSIPTFMLIPNCNGDKLVPLLDEIFPKLNIGGIIGVALAIMKENKGEEPYKIPGRKEPVEGECVQHYSFYSNLNLFK